MSIESKMNKSNIYEILVDYNKALEVKLRAEKEEQRLLKKLIVQLTNEVIKLEEIRK